MKAEYLKMFKSILKSFFSVLKIFKVFQPHVKKFQNSMIQARSNNKQKAMPKSNWSEFNFKNGPFKQENIAKNTVS